MLNSKNFEEFEDEVSPNKVLVALPKGEKNNDVIPFDWSEDRNRQN